MRKLKGFTLVEILIVIVIIGILIGALVPRMQSAQGRARDVARKNDLSQLQSAIITSYADRGEWPGLSKCKLDGGTNTGGCSIPADTSDVVSKALIAAGLNGIPTDPISTNTVTIMSGQELQNGYGYAILQKYGVKNAGFILMAHTEVEGGSNWLECPDKQGLTGGYMTSTTDLKDVIPCTKLTKTDNTTGCVVTPGEECTYTNTTQLRYMLVY